ncbi:MAG: 3-alpha,7-alpha,12-alpha-trihydroxy-5-beta-cholest-24-enoyl-CoA hydratase [Gammaproteobacteria bacterium]|nr:3-alpha,7-alpha,12-alpha-trihydroxy-5-beta-cholest-24-enoyl-CoA hydratase [Gammaproteobacteria bacterium]
MSIDYDALMAMRVDDELCEYTDKDALLYALAVGFGSDPLDRKELPYVFEGASLKTVPTLASMLLPSTFLDNCGWDYDQVLHSEFRLELYRPLPAAARLLTTRRVTAVHDRGASRGAKIHIESEVRLAKDDTALFMLGNTLLARGDGGFGGSRGQDPVPHRLPKRSPDLVCDLLTRSDQALLFRLCGDRNPLHADPQLATRLGFDAPILHGRSTCGVACRAILKTICDYDFTLISGFNVRFSAPVYPGDLITTEMWQDGNVVSFRCLVKSRNAVVINNGKCTLSA